MQQPPSQPAELATVSELAFLVAELDGSAGRLLVGHVADHLGHCRGCELPQGGPMRWPCTLVVIARQASHLQQARRLPGR